MIRVKRDNKDMKHIVFDGMLHIVFLYGDGKLRMSGSYANMLCIPKSKEEEIRNSDVFKDLVNVRMSTYDSSLHVYVMDDLDDFYTFLESVTLKSVDGPYREKEDALDVISPYLRKCKIDNIFK